MKRSAGREAMLARWLHLTRDVLPGMAREHGWPIHLDHCFMRVCLDAALGAPWTDRIARPAVRHMGDAQLAAALGFAESILKDPSSLTELNAASIRERQVHRRNPLKP